MKVLKNFILLFFLSSFSSAFAQDVDASKLVDLSAHYWSHENSEYLVLNFKNEPKWHTYWKNPGSAGIALKPEFSRNNQKLTFEELEWPTPKLYKEKGGIIAYGYSNEYSLFFKLPKGFDKSTELNAKVAYLICKDICIPGQKNLTLKGANHSSKISKRETLKRFENLPEVYKSQFPFKMSLAYQDATRESLTFLYEASFQDVKKLDPNHAIVSPFPNELLDPELEKVGLLEGKAKGSLNTAWDGIYAEPEVELPKTGSFKSPQEFKFLVYHPGLEKSFVTTQSFQKILPEPEGSTKKKEITSPQTITAQTEDGATSQSFFTLIFLAFLGGLILNVMPCVLPVISLKLFGLVNSRNHSHKDILKHNLFYSLGVLTSFWVLALVIIGILSSGKSIGWGFQLQSPSFIYVILLVLMLMTLNLFGLFEFRVPGASKLGSVQLREGAFGDFFNGVLATILSTPCSAPFLGTALTYAFTAGAFETFILFTSMGIGLAFPFILIGLFPKTITWLPKPGLWMDHLKKYLGFALIITIIWLIDVFVALRPESLFLVLFTLSCFFFGVYYFNKIARSNHWRTLGLIFIITISIKTFLNIQKQPKNLSSKNTIEVAGSTWEPWSVEKMQSYKESENYVFIDFTAKWCLTCKVNEKAIIDTDQFRKLVKDKNIKLLLGDWTHSDPKITEFLNKNGLVGVPAYFLQKPDGTLINFGETLSLSKIERNL
ncbi:MAG: protein-disulfide reductase DsbD family protein [Bacteriovoracaceae bacterium]